MSFCPAALFLNNSAHKNTAEDSPYTTTCGRGGKMSVPSDRERMLRLETRAKEADVTLRQLKSYVQLLKQKAGSPQAAAQEAECKKVEADNGRLCHQVTQLKQRLVELEVRNGIEQVPSPKRVPLLSKAQPASPPAANGVSPPPPVTTKSPEAPVKGPAKEKKGGEGEGKKKGGEGEARGKKEKKTGEGGGASAAVDVSRLDMRIGRIVSVERHPDADTLYVEQIDVGEEKPRTVCSGLVAHVAMDSMNSRLVVVLCNLKPVKMRGVVSEAMVMCASSPENVEILDPPEDCVPGDRVTFQGYTGPPDAQLNPKKKVFEQVQPNFLVNEEGVATYRGIPFAVDGKGVCRAATMRGTGIK
ncbi:Aminoacyl tRNA synthase complex-interacting multifunctional protein 1 [Geodia barretti]|uniref:Aminoacyl tRNA synthase complex-interacting multifunctional protein 1 n=1 Tax=Geodia barretti TaxID=519541 RepID=A0AA35X496_GEOBA|nr:Aminoacyl tRNA synthase complex-interacting multifunctional protein 1 [Geodia barretti]